MSDSTRLMLGITAALFVGAGLALVLLTDQTTNGEILIRVGVVLAAAWLVAPLIRRPSVATLVLLIGGAAVVVRPRLIVPLAVAAVVWRLTRRE